MVGLGESKRRMVGDRPAVERVLDPLFSLAGVQRVLDGDDADGGVLADYLIRRGRRMATTLPEKSESFDRMTPMRSTACTA